MSESLSKDRYFEWKLLVEAALFKAGKKISVEELCEGLKIIPKSRIAQIVNELISDYEQYNSALEIYQYNSNTFGFQVKNEIMHDHGVSNFMEGQNFKPNEIKTLAFIAYNQPIELQDVIDFIGKAAKKSVNRLKREGFIQITSNAYTVLNENGEEVNLKTKELS
ncbi:MAG: SMC-Scp complex subunit ScpB, partial [Candidatus Heimdallarchaeota archaeon]|nr:SMC-Scp complex subunit ScpB [Candidatus Heimdallarchaeota archaeon]